MVFNDHRTNKYYDLILPDTISPAAASQQNTKTAAASAPKQRRTYGIGETANAKALHALIKPFTPEQTKSLKQRYNSIFEHYIADTNGNVKFKTGPHRKRDLKVKMSTLEKIVEVADQIRTAPLFKKQWGDNSAIVSLDNEDFVIRVDHIKNPNKTTETIEKLFIVCLGADFLYKPEFSDSLIHRAWSITEGAIRLLKVSPYCDEEGDVLTKLHEKLAHETDSKDAHSKAPKFNGFADLPITYMQYIGKKALLMPTEYQCDLETWLKQNPVKMNDTQDKQLRLDFCNQLMRIFEQLLKCGYQHNDIDNRNIVVDTTVSNALVLKLIDFGFSKTFDGLPELQNLYTCSKLDVERFKAVNREKSDLQSSRTSYAAAEETSNPTAADSVALAIQEENKKIDEQYQKIQTEKYIPLIIKRELFCIALQMYRVLFGREPYKMITEGDSPEWTNPYGEFDCKDIEKFGYDPKLIALLKQMIDLNPDKRPSGQQAIEYWKKLTG